MNEQGRAGGTVGVLVMAHGTPARPEDIPAFYTEIRRGRPPSPEQLADLERRYAAIGGVSPLDAVTAAQAAGIAAALERRAPGRFVVRRGARFSDPRIEAAVAELADAAVGTVVGLVLAPHSSHASVAQYAGRARAAVEGLARGSLPLHMIDHWYDAPSFSALVGARVRAALDGLPAGVRHDALVVFSAHSVPAALVREGDTYDKQVADSALAAAERAEVTHFAVAWQSAGRTDDEWLGPDIRDVIAAARGRGHSAVVVCPIGFVADHLEVLYDVDVEARAVAEAAGIAFARTASFNAEPEFCELLASVVQARADVL